MKRILFALCVSFVVSFFSLSSFAGGILQTSAMPPILFEVNVDRLWQYTGTGVVTDVHEKEGLIVINTNIGSGESTKNQNITYAVLHKNVFNKDLKDSTVKFSYYHQDRFDVITRIEK